MPVGASTNLLFGSAVDINSFKNLFSRFLNEMSYKERNQNNRRESNSRVGVKSQLESQGEACTKTRIAGLLKHSSLKKKIIFYFSN